MISQHYRAKKIAVLDVWRRYCSVRGTTDDGVDLAFWNQRANALEEGRYVLAVVGETKAGKSTLINALLGERVLPTDVLQSSSAVVEIFKSDEKFIEVEYADGHSERVHDDLTTPDMDKAVEYLRRIGALQDRFRSIPTALIDKYIVDGCIVPGGLIPVAELQEASRLRLSGREELITEYVQERTLAKIPVKITFGFPLKYAFDELRLVDSPGVNALGGVQDRTFAYLHNVNAVLFVHSLDGPVEQASFREFITHVVPNRTRQALFLVLSKSGLHSEIEIEEKVGEARSVFSEEFDPQRVIHVDAMLRIVSDEIQGFDSALALKQYYAERRQHYIERYQAERLLEWREEEVNFHTKLLLLNRTLEAMGANADMAIVQRELRHRSNFDVLENAIEEFSAKTPELQLSELLAAIRRGYENQMIDLEQTIELHEKKRRHPQSIEAEIKRIQDALEEYRQLINEVGECVFNDYTGLGGSFQPELEQLKLDHACQIQNATSLDAVRKSLADFHDANHSFVDRVANQMRQRFEAKLRQLGEEFREEHSITIPEVDIAGIEAKAKDDAYRNTIVPRDPEGVWEWTLKVISLGQKEYTKTARVFDQDMLQANIKSSALTGVDKVLREDQKLIREIVDRFAAGFKHSVSTLIEARQNAYEEIKDREKTNTQILQKIEEAQKKKETVLHEQVHVREMVENL